MGMIDVCYIPICLFFMTYIMSLLKNIYGYSNFLLQVSGNLCYLNNVLFFVST